MDNIKAIENRRLEMRERGQRRRRNDDAFSDWMSGDAPGNDFARPAAIPGLTKATANTIIISQEKGTGSAGEAKAAAIYGANGKMADPYARAYSDLKRRIEAESHTGDQYSFAFIREMPLAAKTQVDEEV